jgi:acyl dehydratase
LRAGDHVRARATCVAKRHSDSQANRGVVEMRYQLINQDSAIVFDTLSVNLIETRPQ